MKDLSARATAGLSELGLIQHLPAAAKIERKLIDQVVGEQTLPALMALALVAAQIEKYANAERSFFDACMESAREIFSE